MVEIRTATIDDLPAVVDLWRREGGPSRAPGGPDEVRALIDHDPDALLLAESEGRLVGTVIAGWDGWRCHLDRHVVEPEARRRGGAAALTAAARRRAAACGAPRLDAMVHPENLAAEAFWAANGFALDSDRRWSVAPVGPRPSGNGDKRL